MKNKNFLIAFSSFLLLFLELLVIRWVSTEIRIFAYLSNLILLATFIGSGIGMAIKKRISIAFSSFLLVVLSIINLYTFSLKIFNFQVNLFKDISDLLSPLSDEYLWYSAPLISIKRTIFGLACALFVFSITVLIFIPLGQILGRALNNHKKPLLAYSVNVFFSVLGIWAFQLWSVGEMSPLLGVVVVQALFLFLTSKFSQKLILTFLCFFTILLCQNKEPFSPLVRWSPYQKLSLSPLIENTPRFGWFLNVNNVGYMTLVSRVKIKKDEINGYYDIPYRLKPNAQNVLLIGAGAGNDAAAAIKAHVPQIDAVEIDPSIIELGKQFHPERPYENDQVNIIINDARSFFEQTNKKYDLIVMSLADSQTLSSTLTNLRLDHYLYTEESYQAAKNLLKDDGIFFVAFEAQRPWIGGRIQKGLADVFEVAPKTFLTTTTHITFGPGGKVFITAKEKDIIEQVLKKDKILANFINDNKVSFPSNIKPITDDWPYLYLDKPRLPKIHLFIALILSFSVFLAKKILFRGKSFSLSFFFLGAAFMLVEFQNVSKSSLLFGSTWQTYLFTITAILFLVLLANFAASKKVPINLAFIGLIFSIIIQLLIPLHHFNKLTFINKAIFGSLFLNLPVFFGGIIFATLFARTKNKSQAFAVNFLGSAIGGLFEMFSYLWGISALNLITLLFYSLAFLDLKRKK